MHRFSQPANHCLLCFVSYLWADSQALTTHNASTVLGRTIATERTLCRAAAMSVKSHQLQPASAYQSLADQSDEDRWRSRIAAEAYTKDMQSDKRQSRQSFPSLKDEAPLIDEKDETTPLAPEKNKFFLSCSCINVQLIIVLLLCLILIVIMGFVILSLRKTVGQRCLTPSCTAQGALMLSSMDTSAKPCDDFYQYACGNWDRANPAMPGVGKYSNFYINSLIIKKRIYHLLSKTDDDGASVESVNGRHSTAVAKAKAYFRACQNGAAPRGLKPLQEQIGEMGGWSLTPNIASTKMTLDDSRLMDRMIRMAEYNKATIFTMYVTLNKFNSSEYVYELSQSSGMFPRSKLITDDAATRSAFMAYATNVLVLLGAKNTSTLQHRLSQIWNVDVQLEKMRNSLLDRRNIVVNSLQHKRDYFMTLQRLALLISQRVYHERLRASRLLYYMIKYGQKLVKGKLSKNTWISVVNKNYILNVVKKYLSNLKKGHHLLSDYVTYRFVAASLDGMGTKFNEAKKILQQTVTGTKILPPVWQTCVTSTDSVFRYTTTALYVQKFVNNSTKPAGEKIVGAVIDSLKNSIANAQWMDDKTKAIASKKVNAMTYQVAYPEWIMKVKELDKFYNQITITETDFFSSKNSISRYFRRHNLKKYGTKPNFKEFSMSPLVANAFYTLVKNHITILTAILSPPFFADNFQIAFQMGALGTVAGHEINHGFDSRGSQFNQRGNLKSWWTPVTMQRFQVSKHWCTIC